MLDIARCARCARFVCVFLLGVLAAAPAHGADPVTVTLDARLQGTWSSPTINMDQGVCLTFGPGALAAFKTRFGAVSVLTFASAVLGVDPVEFDENAAISLEHFTENKERCFDLPKGVPEDVFFTLYVRDAAKRFTPLTADKLSRPSAKTTSAPQLSEKDFQTEVKKRIAAAAQMWVLEHHEMLETNHLESGEPWASPVGQARVRLYFLPDGRPAWPLPADLAENDKIDLFVLLPTPEFLVRNGLDLSWRDFNLTFSACQGRNRSRVRGSLTAVDAFIGEAQSAAALPTVRTEDLAEVPAARIACGAGDVTFSIKTSLGDGTAQASTLKLASVYRLTVGLQYTFDTTRSGALGLVAGANGMTTIERSQDLIGLALVPVFVYHPFGYNPDRGSILGTLFGPTLGMEMPTVTDSLYVGDTMCFPLGLCAAFGAHLRKLEDLDPSLGLAVGDPWTEDATTELGTQRVWRFGKNGSALENGTLGFYFGITIDASVLSAIVGG